MRERQIIVWVQRFKDRNPLVLQWTDPESGLRRSKSAGTADVKMAERRRADLEYELNHGTHQQASGLDWDVFRQMFHREVSAGIRPRAREKHETVLDVFEQIIKPRKLRDITERTISRFVQGMRERKKRGGAVGLAAYTVRNYLVVLKTALGWAAEQKMIPGMPSFPKIKTPKIKPQAIPSESFEKLLDKAPDQFWKAYLSCAWWAGMRLDRFRGASDRAAGASIEERRRSVVADASRVT